MSYRRRYNNDSQILSSISTNDKRPKRKINVQAYLRNEFFTCDDIIFKRIADLYCKLYGVGAHNYMISNYYKWKHGYVAMSGKSVNRILECVPKFLTDEKRFFILKCEVEFFLETTHHNQLRNRKRQIKISDIPAFFENYQREIQDFQLSNLSWFLGKGIFTEDELNQFLTACQYCLNKRITVAHKQVFNDLELIKSKLSKYKVGAFEGSYNIDFMNSSFDIKGINEYSLPERSFEKADLNISGVLRQYAEKYILDELLKINTEQKEGKANALIQSNDIDVVFSQFHELIRQDNEVVISSKFQGEGGVLFLTLEYTPFKNLISAISLSLLKILGIVAFIVGMSLLGKKFPAIIVFVFWIALFIIFSKIPSEIRIIVNSIKKVRNNGSIGRLN